MEFNFHNTELIHGGSAAATQGSRCSSTSSRQRSPHRLYRLRIRAATPNSAHGCTTEIWRLPRRKGAAGAVTTSSRCGPTTYTAWATTRFALGLFALGLGGWQILLSLGIGSRAAVRAADDLRLHGLPTGVPFPVMSRIAFGVRGAQLPAVIRGGVAIVWFGIQTYLASLVLRVLLIAVAPGLDRLDHNSILGLSTLGLAHLRHPLAGADLARAARDGHDPQIRGLRRADHPGHDGRAGRMDLHQGRRLDRLVDRRRLTGAKCGGRYSPAARCGCPSTPPSCSTSATSPAAAKTRRSIVGGNFWGIPINVLFFGAIVVVLAGAQFKIDGKVIESPADIVHAIPNTAILVAAPACRC